jgi:hypothetical protein
MKDRTIRDGSRAICPHCGYEHGDCWDWVRTEPHTRECSECTKPFEVWAEVDVEYITRPVAGEPSR